MAQQKEQQGQLCLGFERSHCVTLGTNSSPYMKASGNKHEGSSKSSWKISANLKKKVCRDFKNLPPPPINLSLNSISHQPLEVPSYSVSIYYRVVLPWGHGMKGMEMKILTWNSFPAVLWSLWTMGANCMSISTGQLLKSFPSPS